ncbi:TATA box binding protein associated factor, partial [Oesophagostomum dentatum]
MAVPSTSTSSFAPSFPPRIEPQYVRIVGDSVGVVNLTPAALQCLADKLTQSLLRCSMAARQFAVHGRRRIVKVEDLEHALRSYGLQMPIGALTRSLPSLRQLRMPGGEQLYVREDADLDVPALTQPPQIKIPVKRHIR